MSQFIQYYFLLRLSEMNGSVHFIIQFEEAMGIIEIEKLIPSVCYIWIIFVNVFICFQCRKKSLPTIFFPETVTYFKYFNLVFRTWQRFRVRGRL